MNHIAAKQRGEKTRNKRLVWLRPTALFRTAGAGVQEDESGESEGSSGTEGKKRYRTQTCQPNWVLLALIYGPNKSSYTWTRMMLSSWGQMSVPDLIPTVRVRLHMWQPVYTAWFNQNSWQQRRTQLLNKKINDEFPFIPVKKPINFITGLTCFDLSFITLLTGRSRMFLTF